MFIENELFFDREIYLECISTEVSFGKKFNFECFWHFRKQCFWMLWNSLRNVFKFWEFLSIIFFIFWSKMAKINVFLRWKPQLFPKFCFQKTARFVNDHNNVEKMELSYRKWDRCFLGTLFWQFYKFLW